MIAFSSENVNFKMLIRSVASIPIKAKETINFETKY